MPRDIDSDATVAELRAAISENDRLILVSLNRRLELVGELRVHKAEHGYPSVDEARERWLLDHLVEANQGPLSEHALRSLFSAVLTVTWDEVYGTSGASRPDGDSTGGN